MKVTLVNTADAGGGAPAACMRLLRALQFKQADASLLVQEKKTGNTYVEPVQKGWWGRIKARCRFLAERIPFILFNAEDKSVRFAFSTATIGTSIAKHQLVRQANVLHLHWINQGFLSVNDLKEVVRLGKPVVWTLHDMWAFTGGCHYAGNCNHFTKHCGYCWMLSDPEARDLSNKGWIRKMHLFEDVNSIVFVTCSHWLADMARKSSLLEGYRIETIPNPIDTSLFIPRGQSALRKKWGIAENKRIILFGAANIMDRRKGIGYLVEALDHLKNSYPDKGETEMVIFGKNKAFDVSLLPFKVHEAGIINKQEDMAELYSLADVYVTPAIEDNLPNTVMEALSSGTPVVAFNTGGIPDMIDHLQNGYLAQYKSSADLAAGINFVFENNNDRKLSEHARNKVLQNFTNEIVAGKYLDLYQSLLNS
jgi:glycosyltransferase involved in cell wall biosynthesis